MQKKEIVTYSALVLMTLLIIMAFVASDVFVSNLMASLSILIGAFASNYLSNGKNRSAKKAERFTIQ